MSTLSMMLLVLGIAGFAGTLIVGNALKYGLYGTLVVIPVLMALIAMGLVSFGTSAMAVFVLLGLWGLVATAAPVGWWSWLAQTLPNDAEAGGGLMVAVIQLSIAFGSTLGGVLYDGSGYKATFIVAGALLVVSALVTVVASRVSQARAT